VPPAPTFPEELHLRKVAMVMWCHSGTPRRRRRRSARCASSAAAGRRHRRGAVRGGPERVRRALPARPPWYWKHDFVRELPPEAMAVHEEMGKRLPTPFSTMHLYPVDGAVHDVAPLRHRVPVPRLPVLAGDRRHRPRPDEGRGAQGVRHRVLGGAAPVLRRRRLREHEHGREQRARAGQLRRQLRPPGAHQGRVRPRNLFRANQNIPPQG
jgi:hypothetical protein